ncbi:hypothetical protein RUM43_014713 [Polyplax serrata]|uniref:Uncharacterized protein n=1 Tax=Polyplax serrata TaxID=468196 RepID=A0AAN8S2K4_POLSC
MNTVVERDGGDQQFEEKEEKESVGVVREHGKGANARGRLRCLRLNVLMVTGTNYFGDGKLRRRNVAAERILGMKTSMESKQDAKNKSKEGIERVRETASTSENEFRKQKDPNFKNDLRKKGSWFEQRRGGSGSLILGGGHERSADEKKKGKVNEDDLPPFRSIVIVEVLRKSIDEPEAFERRLNEYEEAPGVKDQTQIILNAFEAKSIEKRRRKENAICSPLRKRLRDSLKGFQEGVAVTRRGPGEKYTQGGPTLEHLKRGDGTEPSSAHTCGEQFVCQEKMSADLQWNPSE